MTFTVEYPNDHKNNVRVNKFSRITGYKVNIQKSVAFLYISNEWSEKQNICLHREKDKYNISLIRGI